MAKKTKVRPGRKKFTREELNLMRAIKLREKAKGAAVTAPGEVFAILQAIGYQRKDEMDVQERAREFVVGVRKLLRAANRRRPTYRMVLQAMRQLGYSRPPALAT